MRSRIAPIAAALLMGVAMAPTLTPAPAQAFGFGGIVFDPKNYAQNLMTAARTLQTINNQVRQLQNEADMLINDAKNLVRTGYNPQADINRLLSQIQALMDRAKAISYTVSETDRIFRERYPDDYSAWSRTEMAAAAEFQWTASHNALHDSMRIQAEIVQTVKADAASLDSMLTETDRAEGNLQVAQTGNQIMAMGVKQSMQMQQLMTAQYRAEALERARRLQIEREAKVKFERFAGGSTAYTRR